jgi:hypothetical protein
LFGPSRSVRSPSTRDFPLHGTMASADFLHLSYTLPHRFRYGGTVRQSPFQVCARPPRVRASNLRPMLPPHLHHSDFSPRVRVVSDFALSCKLVRPVLPYMRFLSVGSGLCPSELLFAGFLQIPPHDGHPCLWLPLPTTKRVADFHRQVTPHAGRT